MHHLCQPLTLLSVPFLTESLLSPLQTMLERTIISNDGLTDDFQRVLIEANITGMAWAREMRRRHLDAKEKKKVPYLRRPEIVPPRNDISPGRT